MTQKAIYKQGSVAETLRRLGQCLELVPMDPHFHGMNLDSLLRMKLMLQK